MPELIGLATAFATAAVVAPFVLVALLGLPTLVDRPLSERFTSNAAQAIITFGFLTAFATLVLMLISGERDVPVNLGGATYQGQVVSERHQYHFHFLAKFTFDRLSTPMAILSFALCGAISAFASRYLHREPGYNRFFVLFSIFLAGMVTASLANTIETFFTGWELVGLSSALLVAFYQERPAPVQNGLRVWIVYRASDAALLLAAVALHHMTGEGDFDQLLGEAPWPNGATSLTAWQSLLIGMLLLLAAAGKSALIPFSGWLPRAMEGPTPSSAVFYGALSVHLGAFVLLRASPLIAASIWLALAIIILGLATAAYAYLVGTVQTDIKSALSFASLGQVGIIVAEIGLVHFSPIFCYVALTHLLGNSLLRTLQFVRAPSLLRDFHELENALGERPPRPPGPVAYAPLHVRAWLYRFSLERGYLDALLSDYVIHPVVAAFRKFDGFERQWVDFLNGRGPSDGNDAATNANPPSSWSASPPASQREPETAEATA